jgi:hypothetical protein
MADGASCEACGRGDAPLFAKNLCKKCFYGSSRRFHPCGWCGEDGVVARKGKRCGKCCAAALALSSDGDCVVCGDKGKRVKGECLRCYGRGRRMRFSCPSCGKPSMTEGDCIECIRRKARESKKCPDCGDFNGGRRNGQRCRSCAGKLKLRPRACVFCGKEIQRKSNGDIRVSLKCNECLASRAISDEEKQARARQLRNTGKIRAKRRMKFLVIESLGGKCDCCSEDRIELLTVDHVQGNGKDHRKVSRNIYRDIVSLGFPRDLFRVLCFNCNCSIGAWGYCPHGKSEEELEELREANLLSGVR